MAAAKSSLIFCAFFVPAIANAETSAGVQISNTATLRYKVAGTDSAINSNPVATTVAERLDVTLAAQGSPPIRQDGTGYVATLTLRNQGNGQEAFALQAALNNTQYTVATVAIDRDGDGRYDPAHDQLIANGQTPALQPGEALPLVVVLNAATPGAVADGVVLSVVARASTGSGAPGTVFAGQGDGNGDAVVGPTGAEARVALSLGGNGGAAAPTFVKSQAVVAPDGSARAVKDAVITYSLTATFAGATAGALIGDPVPAGTTYVPGSLRLDSMPLSDAADGDAGSFDGTAIQVVLGDIASAATRTVKFQVKIK